MSNIDKITELKLKAAHQLAEMRRILDENNGEGGLTAEQAAEYDRREADFEATTALAEREERAAGISPEPSFTEARSIALPTDEDVLVDEGVQVEEKRSDVELFDRFLRSKGQDVEARATMKVGTDSAGGYLVPDEWSDQIVKSLIEQTSLLDVANVLRTSAGNPIHIPIVTADEVTAAIAEEGDYSDLASTLSEAVLGAWKAGYVVKVSEELVSDSAFDVSSFVRDQAARSIGKKLSAWLVTGAGTTEPQGIAKATVGVTTASSTAITADELIDQQHKVTAPYRASAHWFLADSALKLARKLTGSGSGDYLLQPGLSAGAPATLLGNPVHVEAFDAVAAGKIVGVFGDPRGFTIRQAGGINVRVLDQTFAETGQVGYRVDIRIDSAITDTNALSALKMKV